MHRAATSTDIFNRILPFVWEFSDFFLVVIQFFGLLDAALSYFSEYNNPKSIRKQMRCTFFVYFQRQCQVYKTIAEVMVWLEAAATVIIEYRAIATP